MQESRGSVFVGRDTEVETLLSIGHRLATGRGAVVLVEGNAGIGKTALLDAVEHRYAAAGLQVRRGGVKELQQAVPFAALCSWLNPHSSSSGAPPDPILELLLDGDRAGDGADTHEFAVTEAFLERIDTWCSAGPVALILDDAHWADRPSLSVLRRLSALVGDTPLLVLLAARPLSGHRAFLALATDLAVRGFPIVRLAPLPDTATAAIVRQMVGAVPGSRLMGEVIGAGGNPLYITEMVAALLRDNAITVVADIADPTDSTARGRTTTSLSDAITQRLELLSTPARHILLMAAALGPTINIAELATVLDSQLLEVWGAVAEATDGELLTRVNSELVFRHDLIREVLTEQLPASLRSDLLRRAGQVLQATEAPIERVAYYLCSGDHALDPASTDWLIAVSDRLAVVAPERAVRLLGRAADTEDLDATKRSILIRLHAQALLWNGCAAEAEAIARSTLLIQADDVELRWLLTQACHAQGRFADAVAVAQTALSLVQLDDEAAGRFHGVCALDNFLLGRLDAAQSAGKQALAIGEATEDPRATGYGLMALGAVRYTRGYFDEALELSNRILAVFENGTEFGQFDPYVLHAHCLFELDRFADAEAILRRAIVHNRRVHGVYLGANLLAKARLHLLEGRWDDAIAECRSCSEAPDALGFAAVAHIVTALIGIHRGIFTLDPDALTAPDGSLASSGYAHFHPWVRALLHERHGEPDIALKLLVDACERLTDSMATPTLYYIFPDTARLAADLGHEDAAGSVLAAADELLARQQTTTRRGIALLCRGLAEREPTMLFIAAQAFRQSGLPLYEAHSYENAAVLLAAAGDADEARTALNTAVELYAMLGASWDTARAVARVRPYGIRRGVRGARNRPKSGVAALTDTERKVAALITDGFSNSDIAAQMFLSRRTIQSHVSSILLKLDLRSRREIGAVVPGVDRGPGGDVGAASRQV